MNPRLDHLKQQLISVKAEIQLRTDNINRMKWEVEELSGRQRELIWEIQIAFRNRTNHCPERAL